MVVAVNSRRWWMNSGRIIHVALPNRYFDQPGWPGNFHFTNRPVRTRMPGGVAGVLDDQ